MKARKLGLVASGLASLVGCGTVPNTDTSNFPTDFGNGSRMAIYEKDLQEGIDNTIQFSLEPNQHVLQQPLVAGLPELRGLNGEEAPIELRYSNIERDGKKTNYTLEIEDLPGKMPEGTEIDVYIPIGSLPTDARGQIVPPRIVGSSRKFMGLVSGKSTDYLKIRLETNGGHNPNYVSNEITDINNTLDDLTSNGIPNNNGNQNGNPDMNTNGNQNNTTYTLDDITGEFEQNGIPIDPIVNSRYAAQFLRIPKALDEKIVGGIDGIFYTITDNLDNSRIFPEMPGDIARIGEENGIVTYRVTTGIGIDNSAPYNEWDVFEGIFSFTDGENNYKIIDNAEVLIE